ncbi:MAG: OmpH family outer membrane protein [Vampirovibrionales bacterium]|nr:OmpH family outer membrane protein [Vampirovibrionales bacterium]
MKHRLLLSAMALASVCSLPAFAETIGYVDFDKVFNEYDKAQTVMADMKVKEADLRKVQADFVKQIEESKKTNTKNPVANTTLEKDLSEKLNARINEYRDWASSKQKEIEGDIRGAVTGSATKRGVDVVLTEQAVFQGGLDLTADVITKLNTSTASAPAAKPAK